MCVAVQGGGGKDKGWFPWHDVELCVEGPAAWD